MHAAGRAPIAKSPIFLLSGVFFILGIFLAPFFPKTYIYNDILFFAVFIALVALTALQKIYARGAPRYAFLCLMALMFFMLGVWRYSFSLAANTPDKVWYYNGRAVEITGVINKEPDERANNQKLTLKVLSVNNAPAGGNVVITAKLYPSYSYGEALNIKCKLKAPEPFNEFAYDRYLARYNVYSICYYPEVNKLNIVDKSLFKVAFSHILHLKNRLKEVINYGLPEPKAALANAILLGNRRGLDDDLLNTFSRAGISHVIAISGMHIAIISAMLLYVCLAAGLARKQAFVLAGIFLTAYIILIGAPASALRAGLMAMLAMAAVYLGRLNNTINSLLLAACVLLLFNPKLLAADIGFQLSFLAVFGIIFVKPVIDGWIKKIKFVEAHCNAPLPKGIIDIITITLAAQVLTLPVIAFYFHQVSVAALPVNLLILPVLPFIMVLGIIAAAVGSVFFSAAQLLFIPVYFLLTWVVWAAKTGVAMPWAYFEIDYVRPGWVVLFYALLGLGIWRHNKHTFAISNFL